VCAPALLPGVQHRLRKAISALKGTAALVPLLELDLHAANVGGAVSSVGVARPAADALGVDRLLEAARGLRSAVHVVVAGPGQAVFVDDVACVDPASRASEG